MLASYGPKSLLHFIFMKALQPAMATDAATLDSASLTRTDPLVRAVPVYYGWVMLAVAMATQFASSPGQTFIVALFNKHIAHSLGISLTTLAMAFLWGTVLASLPLPWIGAMADRFGLRKTLAVVTLLFGLSCILMSQVQGPWTLFLGFLAIRTLGQGAFSLLANNTPDMWFRRNLGFATGIRNLAMPLALLTVPTLTIFWIANYGWQWAYIFSGLAIWIGMFPLLIFLFRDRPEEIGQFPDGELTADGDTHRRGPDPSILVPQLTLHQAFLNRSFWIVVSMMTMWAMIGTAMTFNVVPFMESRGLSETDSNVIFAYLAISMAICQFFGGILADRFKLQYLLFIGTLGLASSVVLFWSINSVAGAALYGVAFGVAQGIASAGSNSLWARYFGRAHLGRIKGFSMMTIVAGSAVGPLVMTAGYDLFGSYDGVLLLFVAMFIIQAFVCLLATPPPITSPTDQRTLLELPPLAATGTDHGPTPSPRTLTRTDQECPLPAAHRGREYSSEGYRGHRPAAATSDDQLAG